MSLPFACIGSDSRGAGPFEVAFRIERGLDADRDVIVVDQRGTHYAEPRLN